MKEISRNRYIRLFEDEITELRNNGNKTLYRSKYDDLMELIELNSLRPTDIKYYEDMKTGVIEYKLT